MEGTLGGTNNAFHWSRVIICKARVCRRRNEGSLLMHIKIGWMIIMAQKREWRNVSWSPWKLGRFWWIWMDENKMLESIWRQCRDPGDRGVECHSHPGGIDWLLGWVLASSIFRSLGAGHWQYEHTARAEYRCALDQRSPNRGSGHTSQSQTHTRRHFLGHSSRESIESRFSVGERVDSD